MTTLILLALIVILCAGHLYRSGWIADMRPTTPKPQPEDSNP